MGETQNKKREIKVKFGYDKKKNRTINREKILRETEVESVKKPRHYW